MVHKRRQRTDRWLDLVEDPATLRAICDHIAEGGALPEWCRAQGVRFADVNAWLSADDGRRLLYDQAKKGRDEYLGEIVIRNLRQLAEADWRDAYDAKGALLPFTQWPEGLRRAVLRVEYDTTLVAASKGSKAKRKRDISDVRLVDPAKAVELLGKYRRMFVDKVEHSGSLTLEDLVGASMPAPAPTAPTAPTPTPNTGGNT